ncbi:MAG TPA: helix-turn-helix domain-containing protein [Candidatus Enterenecus stercoripullorum]|nr:helix-turn-helix domain-containing protein [Candidatus Enterenecus stercoripullorum]
MWLDAIRDMKSKSGLTTSEIALHSGIPEPTLEKLFAGKVKDPKLPTMQKLVRFFGYTLDNLDDQTPGTKKSPTPAGASTGDISLEASNELLVALGYIKPGEQISDNDLAFIAHVIGLLDAWFDKGLKCA